jgi:hypothetical protein
MTAVANRCGPVASPRSGKRLGSPPHEQQRADTSPCIAEC